VDSISVDYALGKIRSWVNLEHGGRYIVTLDALSALRAREDKKYRDLVRGADLVLPDGKGLLAALAFLGTPVAQRIPGVEFVEKMCRLAASEGWPVFFLGGAEGVAEKAAAVMERKFPGLSVGGFSHGYVEPGNMPSLLEDIKRSGSRFIFVGMGVPRQEKWMSETGSTIDNSVSIGVGGSFDVISGNLKRAPSAVQKMGLEWLYRLIQEPWRWSRIKRLPEFVFKVILTRIGFSSLKGD
jgi:N-acetylglucosaminyldiphosphoundecaprenol N-acetyl-beta-D-mannosaminyltransferase